MALEFDLAFLDLQQGIPNREKLMIFADSHYVNGLDTARFCSSLQRLLVRQQSVRDDSSIVHNFIHDSCYLYTENLMIERRLKSMKDSISEQLHAIGVSKKRHSVLLNTAAMICAAVAAAVAVNAIPVSLLARAVIGVIGAAGSILFGALGRWRQSALKKRETAVNKHKDITEHMCTGARIGMKHLLDIHHVAIRLYLETEALSEAIHDREKDSFEELLKDSFEELLRNDEAYSKSMKSVRQEVLVSLRGL